MQDPRDRRIHGLTEIGIAGPVRGATQLVTKVSTDGTGEWLALAPGETGLSPENGFADLADIPVNTRLAADQAGATKMDRAEGAPSIPTRARSASR